MKKIFNVVSRIVRPLFNLSGLFWRVVRVLVNFFKIPTFDTLVELTDEVSRKVTFVRFERWIKGVIQKWTVYITDFARNFKINFLAGQIKKFLRKGYTWDRVAVYRTFRRYYNFRVTLPKILLFRTAWLYIVRYVFFVPAYIVFIPIKIFVDWCVIFCVCIHQFFTLTLLQFAGIKRLDLFLHRFVSGGVVGLLKIFWNGAILLLCLEFFFVEILNLSVLGLYCHAMLPFQLVGRMVIAGIVLLTAFWYIGFLENFSTVLLLFLLIWWNFTICCLDSASHWYGIGDSDIYDVRFINGEQVEYDLYDDAELSWAMGILYYEGIQVPVYPDRWVGMYYEHYTDVWHTHLAGLIDDEWWNTIVTSAYAPDHTEVQFHYFKPYAEIKYDRMLFDFLYTLFATFTTLLYMLEGLSFWILCLLVSCVCVASILKIGKLATNTQLLPTGQIAIFEDDDNDDDDLEARGFAFEKDLEAQKDPFNTFVEDSDDQESGELDEFERDDEWVWLYSDGVEKWVDWEHGEFVLEPGREEELQDLLTKAAEDLTFCKKMVKKKGTRFDKKHFQNFFLDHYLVNLVQWYDDRELESYLKSFDTATDEDDRSDSAGDSHEEVTFLHDTPVLPLGSSWHRSLNQAYVHSIFYQLRRVRLLRYHELKKNGQITTSFREYEENCQHLLNKFVLKVCGKFFFNTSGESTFIPHPSLYYQSRSGKDSFVVSGGGDAIDKFFIADVLFRDEAFRFGWGRFEKRAHDLHTGAPYSHALFRSYGKSQKDFFNAIELALKDLEKQNDDTIK